MFGVVEMSFPLFKRVLIAFFTIVGGIAMVGRCEIDRLGIGIFEFDATILVVDGSGIVFE